MKFKKLLRNYQLDERYGTSVWNGKKRNGVREMLVREIG